MRLHANTVSTHSHGPQASSYSSRLASAAPLPPPNVYESAYQYWPWGDLIDWIADQVSNHAPKCANIVDYMCGTGYLLARIFEQRPDVRVLGCDIHEPFVRFAKINHVGVQVRHADALNFVPERESDLILCTAGLHHLNFEQQEIFLDKLFNEAKLNTTVVIGEEAIGEYEDEQSRRIAALQLNSDMIAYGLERGWPAEQIEAAVEVMKNDIMARGEYKRSVAQWYTAIEARFQIYVTKTLWSPASGGGDVVFMCRKMPSINEL